MTLICFDVEASGPTPVNGDIVSIGCVVVDGQFTRTFYGEARPLLAVYNPSAYAAIGVTREEHENYPLSQDELARLLIEWAKTLGRDRHTLVSDNPAWDWQWPAAMFARAGLDNPFGHSARRIGDFAAGLDRDWSVPARKWKRLRQTRHTHNALDDAKGNAEALWTLMQRARTAA